ncbi:hypothetical protein TanjilG_31978 [Lupinus angustifolius]|uniref:Uncharacterized protein n=1 Tax=Lupinus angustifolius TaxID=3871 RepID=A0A394DA15_LUPAN|nr:hypothetical protein TanjilG_31978 [Lupinus angustifolius]
MSLRNKGKTKLEDVNEGSENKAFETASMVGLGVAAVAVAVVGAFFLFGSDSKRKSMKAPGRNYRIFRDDFERDPGSYFRDLRK